MAPLTFRYYDAYFVCYGRDSFNQNNEVYSSDLSSEAFQKI